MILQRFEKTDSATDNRTVFVYVESVWDRGKQNEPNPIRIFCGSIQYRLLEKCCSKRTLSALYSL